MSPKRSGDPSDDHWAERLARFLSAQVGSPIRIRQGEAEFLRRLSGFRQARRNVKWFALGLLMTSAFVAVGLAGFRFRHQEPAPVPLSYRVDNRAPPSDGYILVPQAAESLIAFSDGSKVRMEARARGRVVEVNHRG